ncbi:Utp14-domain-containing protein [Dothidotthia symphoricarpi CBS 119687]|uniref:Utp14-domain-containing protein n=1 Tax=Dothidotthia symphoricarpi CBS 119687 TaxID=1392245 RepID=A0A6A6AGV0_9PLEO|nr:Utp14-domain-containing protein [Dothidotthia symphoricarpi CBS 119687]KAF2130335.1 Utp14-domain-containing protein [Dothidotthia symphoricarpi CBS 119687]
MATAIVNGMSSSQFRAINAASRPKSLLPSFPRSLALGGPQMQRALNAFAIAQYENPDTLKIRRNRLGEVEGPSARKRTREDDDDEEEDEEDDKKKRRRGDESFDEGSDSEGNTWTMGHVEDDDDEDIDSDEAFGESDEERFEGYTFRGSSTMKGKPKGKKAKRQIVAEDSDMDLDEGDSADAEDDEDDLGEDAIDLATALDQYEEDEREEKRSKKDKKKASAFDDSEEEGPSEAEDVAADGASDLTSSDDDEDEEDRQAQLKHLISSLATADEGKKRGKRVEVHESAVPDEFGVSRKVDLLSFKPKVADEEKKRALKLLQDDKSSKRNDIARRLDAPLPKRQQDKIDRAAANTKANETLDRWTDTIKQNRRAEHLMFPLQHRSAGKPMGEDRLLPTTSAAPANDLESTIQSILQQSGLSNGKDDEEQIQKWEELQTNKMPLEEVMKRRAQLRMARELLFREEVRAKRIKKIKSKSYRRVHRKEREKLLQKEREGLKADGIDLSEEEREYNDRRRAEERMGAKHRESKWAKGIKATGRANWDEDALAGVTEMAKRNEELRRRVEGKAIRDSDDEGSDVPKISDSENPFSTDKSKLGQMAFMQKSEAARRLQNDQAVESMRRELAGDSDSEDGNENAARVGRRKYGPGGVAAPAIQISRNEFEEHPGSDDEEGQNTATAEPTASGLSNGSRKTEKTKNPFATGVSNGARKAQKSAAPETDEPPFNPFLTKATKSKKAEPEPELFPFTADDEPAAQDTIKPQSKSKSKAKAQAKPDQQVSVDAFLQQRITAADDDGWATVLGDQDDDDDATAPNDEAAASDPEHDGLDMAVILRNQALTSTAFAGDNVAADFLAEKTATTALEEATQTTSYLPGWGAWTGSGMSKREAKRNKGYKTVTATEGIQAERRKDAKLDRVIVNEKRVKPNIKYMAGQLPFPFESREQYERSLRVPKGREWTTKKTFQEGTRPRVIVRQGVVAPLRKPMV